MVRVSRAAAISACSRELSAAGRLCILPRIATLVASCLGGRNSLRPPGSQRGPGRRWEESSLGGPDYDLCFPSKVLGVVVGAGSEVQA